MSLLKKIGEKYSTEMCGTIAWIPNPPEHTRRSQKEINVATKRFPYIFLQIQMKKVTGIMCYCYGF